MLRSTLPRKMLLSAGIPAVFSLIQYEDAIEISGGRQSLVLGDAFLIGTGVANGFGRAALYLQPRASFDNVALLKLNLEPVRARFFNLETASTRI